jgi:hypothetical protein
MSVHVHCINGFVWDECAAADVIRLITYLWMGWFCFKVENGSVHRAFCFCLLQEAINVVSRGSMHDHEGA